MAFLDDILKKLKANTLDKTNLDEKIVGGVKQIATGLGNTLSSGFNSMQDMKFGTQNPQTGTRDFRTSLPYKTISQGLDNLKTNLKLVSRPDTQAEVTRGIDPVRQFAVNRLIAPMAQVPYNLKEAVGGGQKSLFQRGLHGLSAVAGMLPGADDLVYAGYDYLKGVKSEQQRGTPTLQSYKKGVDYLTGEKTVGLGDALTTDPVSRDVLNLAELPLTFMVAGKVNRNSANRQTVLQSEKAIRQLINNVELSKKGLLDLSEPVYRYADNLVNTLLPNLNKSSVLRQLKDNNPKEWVRRVAPYLEDALVQAKNPSLNMGFNVRKLGRLDDNLPTASKNVRPGASSEVPTVIAPQPVGGGKAKYGNEVNGRLEAALEVFRKTGDRSKAKDSFFSSLEDDGVYYADNARKFNERIDAAIDKYFPSTKVQPKASGEVPKTKGVGGEGTEGTEGSATKPLSPTSPKSSTPKTRLLPEPSQPSGRRLDTILSGQSDVKYPSTDIIQEAKREIGSVPTKADKPLKQQLSDFYTNWVNRFQPLEDVANKIEKDLGASILPEKNPVYTTRRLLGAGGVAEYRHKKVLEPILSELGDIPSSDFDVFLKAKRDLNLGARGKVGSDATKAQQVIDALGNKYDLGKLENVAGKLYAYQDEGLNMLREAGLVSQEAFDKIKNTSKNYVPFQRVMDEVDSYLGIPTKKGYVGTSPVQRIKGSERQILSPVESIIANTYKIESAVSRNRVAQSLVNLRQIAPQYADMFEKVSKDSADTIAVWEEGKKNFYRVGEDIARSIKGLNEENVGILTKILSAPAQLLRQGATGRNPDFMIPNVFKDQFDAAITSKYGYKPFVDYFRGLGHLLNYKRTGSDQLVEEWMKSGGSIFFENLGGRKQLSEQIADATTKKGVLRQLKDWAIGGIDTIGELSETPTRLGLYQRAKEATGNEWLAMMESREGTLDFARMGAKMKVFNSIIPFLNVDVQGFDKLIRSAKDHPGKMALNMTLYAGMPQLLISLYNNAFHPDEYANVPQWEKDTNFVVVTGKSEEGTPQYLKIPKGNIVPLIANPTDQLVSYLSGTDKQGFGKFALSLLSDTLPIVEGGSNLQEVFTKTLGSNLPQAIKPVFENAFNKSTFYTDEQGKPQDIVPYYMENKPPSQQFKKSTPEAYKALGKILNVSPLKAQNLLEGYLSGFVKTPTNITQILKDVSQGKDIDPNKVPILRRFFGEREDFYTSSSSKTQDSRFAASAAEPNLLQRLFKRGVKEDEVQQLPTDPKALGVIYNEARKDFDAYEDKKLKIEYGNYEDWEKQSKLETLDQEYQYAKSMVERIEQQRPEAILKMNLDLHASSGSKTVEERSTWAAQELGKASDQKQFDALVEQMLEAKVLTKSVAEALREQGIPIDRYTEGGKIKTLGSGGGPSKDLAAILKAMRQDNQELSKLLAPTPARRPRALDMILSQSQTKKAPSGSSLRSILSKRRQQARTPLDRIQSLT